MEKFARINYRCGVYKVLPCGGWGFETSFRTFISTIANKEDAAPYVPSENGSSQGELVRGPKT